jgi:predicted PurR-regulated permease PerM
MKEISWKWDNFLKIIGFLILLLLLWQTISVWILVFASIVLALALSPIFDNAEKLRIPRGITLLFVLLAFIGIGFALINIVGRPLSEQTDSLIQNLDQINLELSSQIESATGIKVNGQIQSGIADFGQTLFTRIFSFGLNLFNLGVTFISFLALTSYILLEEKSFIPFIKKSKLNDYWKIKFEEIWTESKNSISRWALGVFASMILVGVTVYISLRLAGVPYALPLAILAGTLEFIPLLGPTLSAAPAVIIGSIQSPTLGGITLLIYILIQQLEAHIFIPQVMKKAVELNPILVVISLLVGTQLLGVLGTLLAIPALLVIRIIINKFWIN